MANEALRATPLFADLAPQDLDRVAARAEAMELEPDDLLLAEGTPADALFVVASGSLAVSKRSGDAEVPLAVVGPGEVVGEMAVLEGALRSASIRAAAPSHVLRIPADALRELLAGSPEVALGVIRTAVGRLRSTEALLRQREKLAGLGTLAAGLAHELNNPAAAIRRSVIGLAEAIEARDALPPPPDAVRHLRPAGPAELLSALERADRIDEMSALLDDEDVGTALVDAGWDPRRLEAELAELPAAERRAAAAWLSLDAGIRDLLGEVRTSGERISEIVGAVKDYSYLDQAPVQRIDVRDGLEKTLVILAHKLRQGVSVMRDFAPDLPEIEAYGSELNQVWTNIIDNAVDAMDGRGELTVRAEREGEGVRVTICDTGPGIPPEVVPRLFEPFFTTKPPGVGTGLGLHISHNVVVRHGGELRVDSQPGHTCFTVVLPPQLPRRG